MYDTTDETRSRASSETEARRSQNGSEDETLYDTTGPSTERRVPSSRLSRRSFLAASAATGALAFGTGAASARTVVEESCEGEFEEIDVADGFQLLNNQWGMPDADQCIWLNDDGSYGYDFSATSGGINYPEVYIGTRPWGDDTGVAEFPIRRGDVDELTMEWDVDIDISGGDWNLAEEWWLLDGEPQEEEPPLTHEIMLVLDYGGGHGHGGDEETAAIQDQYGNQIDYWQFYDAGGTDADFHIFKINGGASSGRVDLTTIIDYMDEHYGLSDDLTLTGIELGNEYWEGAEGEVTYEQFDVTVNGSTYTSGSDGGSGGWDGGDDTDDSDDSTDDETDDTDDHDDSTDDGDDHEDDSDDAHDGDAVAVIDPDTTTPAVGEYVDFHIEDTSGSSRWITDLEWDLGNGSTDSGWHAGTTYDSAGEYVVELTATANDGTTTTDTVTVTVGDGGSDDSDDHDDSTDDSTDDGTDDHDDTDDSTEDDGSDDGTDAGDDEPHVEIDPSTTSASAGETVYFGTDANEDWITDLQWDMGDGTTVSGSWHVSHAFDEPGTYTVELETESGHDGTRTTDAVTIDVS